MNNHHCARIRTIGPILFFLSIVTSATYLLPWVQTTGIAFDLSAYDLAEWITLHPGGASLPDPMTTSLLLRLPLVAIIWITALHGTLTSTWSSYVRISWLMLLFALLLFSAPPAEFLDEPSNPNYRQQMMLTGLALAGTVVLMTGILRRVSKLLVPIFGITAVLCSFIGLGEALRLLRDYDVKFLWSAGWALFSVSITVQVVLSLRHLSVTAETAG